LFKKSFKNAIFIPLEREKLELFIDVNFKFVNLSFQTPLLIECTEVVITLHIITLHPVVRQ